MFHDGTGKTTIRFHICFDLHIVMLIYAVSLGR